MYFCIVDYTALVMQWSTNEQMNKCMYVCMRMCDLVLVSVWLYPCAFMPVCRD